MRKLVLLFALLAAVLAPTAARAQEAGLRDPFDPLITVEDDTTTTTTDTDTTDTDDTTTTTTDTDPDPAPTDGLPTTGSDPRSWLAIAYVLLAAGAVILALTREVRALPRKLR